ncbi:MAG: hypothetical protein KDK39_02255 [Leptospiraceae bacterium]|nr:hypothetical protein [Leptospiraceae bacterium]
MNIFVNNQELEASLQGEQNLEQVYEAVNRWISENKRYILGMQVDQNEIAIGELKDLSTSEVERFDFFVGDELDMMLGTLEELDRYVDQIGSTLFEMHTVESKDRENLQEGLQWIRQILESFAIIMKMELSAMSVLAPGSDANEAVDQILERLELQCQTFARHSDRDAIEGFLEDLRSFKFFIMKMSLQLRTMSARESELIAIVKRFAENLDPMVAKIVAINTDFSAGRDEDGFTNLESLTAELNEYLSALFALDYQLRQKEGGVDLRAIEVDGQSFYQMARELTDQLRELNKALEENDIVATGDILEYELAEKLQQLGPWLTEIMQFVLAKEGA